MAWNKLMQLIFGGSLVIAQTLPSTPAQSMATLDELLSHECARSITSFLYAGDQPGPLFYDGDLAFTSVDTATLHPLLVVSAGNGVFSVALEGAGVNRVRFTLPTKNGERNYFLSYLHGNQSRSRVFEFSSDYPPLGKDAFDFEKVQPRRAEALLSHFEYAIYQTAESTLANLTEGRLHRDQLKRVRAENCEHIARRAPHLAQNIKRNLDVIEMIVFGPELKPRQSTRMPASIAARKLVPLTSVD